MRLTLRTLLAYLDDLLERRDAEDLQSKIQSSPLASELVHRIRNAVGQIRLDSPAVDGQGMGGDPNTVAEYLDNTLPPERVPDFERVCLDSDVHLGEVAACHQVLTLVLGEPAEVSPAMRRRVYSIGQEQDADVDVLSEPHDASLGSTRLPVTAAVPSESAGQRVDQAMARPAAAIPAAAEDERWKSPADKRDYTEAKSVRWVPLMLTALVAFVLVFVGLRNLGPFDGSHPIAQMFGGGQQLAQGSADGVQVPEVELDPETQAEPEATADEAGAYADGQNELDGTANQELPLPGASTPAFPNVEHTEHVGNTPSDAILDEVVTDSQVTDSQVADGQVADDQLGTDDDLIVANDPSASAVDGIPIELAPLEQGPGVNDLAIARPDPAAVLPPEPRPLGDPIGNRIRNPDGGNTNLVPAFPGTVESNEVADPTANAEGLPDANAESFDPVLDGGSGEPEAPAELGRVMAEEDVALFMNPATQSWERPAVGTPLMAGDEYLSLPVFRPRLLMENGAQVTLVGATSVQFQDPQRKGVPHIHVNYGRLLVMPNNDQGLDLDLQIGDREVQLLFDDASSGVAIEIRREHAPGTDPTVQPPHVVVEVYATSGNVHWIEVNQDTILVAAGQRLAFADDRMGVPSDVASMPSWINQEFSKPHEKPAMQRLGPKISIDRPAVVSLQEQTQPTNRLLEVRSLAVCALAHLGDVQPLVMALNDESLKAYRAEQVDTLKSVVASDPLMAAEIRNALEMQHAERTDELFRMLWGYSPEDLQSGADKELVNYLQDESLDFRIVAIETLKQIVGKAGTRFIPEQTENRRRRGAVYWQKEAENGRIAYKETPEIVQLLNP